MEQATIEERAKERKTWEACMVVGTSKVVAVETESGSFGKSSAWSLLGRRRLPGPSSSSRSSCQENLSLLAPCCCFTGV